VDVRVVAATHKNLEAEVAAGRFREDLYYRINVLPITTTALRERPDDIAALLQFYAEKHTLPGNRPLKFTPDMLQLMQAYAWPGNVRELSNLVDRFSTLFPSQSLQVHTVPACMMPSGLAALQAQRLNQMPTPALQQTLFSPGATPQATVAEGEPSWAPAAAAATDSPWGDNDPLSHLFASSDNASALAKAPRPAFAPMPLSASNDEMSSVEEVILLAQGIQTLPPDGISLKQHLIDIERNLIEQALSRTQGNVSQTAKLLQLQRTTLIEKINKYELRGVA
jgi:sigma-54 specific flagellar transcriptional regulator A